MMELHYDPKQLQTCFTLMMEHSPSATVAISAKSLPVVC